ncbi:MAG: hypothetical protein EKK40_04550 [Bradyrhizobiaceae bacterium]|nr:MAG: hypothetical protein EKK40_04550 [Bradyrhizobiaceae bacterium]
MIATWGEWKSYPKGVPGDRLEAPIGPGIYEVRNASTGALYAFGAVDSLAEALARIGAPSRSLATFFIKREAHLPDLEYRTCATDTKAQAKIAAERMIGRREAFLAGAA